MRDMQLALPLHPHHTVGEKSETGLSMNYHVLRRRLWIILKILHRSTPIAMIPKKQAPALQVCRGSHCYNPFANYSLIIDGHFAAFYNCQL